MELFWNFFEIFATIFEAFIQVRFVLKFQKYNFSSKSSKFKYIYISLAFAAFSIVLTYFMNYEGVTGILYCIFLFVVSMLFVQSSVITKIFVSIVTDLISLALSSSMTGAFSVAFKMPLTDVFFEMSWVRFGCVVCTQLLKYFTYDIILKITQSKGLKLDKKEWILILTVFGFSFISIALVQTAAVKMSSYSAILFVAELCCIIVTAVCFYMTILLNRSKHESERLKLSAQQESFSQQYADNIKKQYEEISKVRHDMKQTNSVVMGLLAETKIDEAIEYLQKSALRISEFDAVVNVGNDFVNAILNAKLSEAKRSGITILWSADKNALKIDETDLCNLLGNLLDNAIEACEKCKEDQRIIELKIRMCGKKHLIMVENTAPEKILENNKQLATTKDDLNGHGYGIKSIKSIAQKYNGIVNFSQTGNKFKTTIVLSIV